MTRVRCSTHCPVTEVVLCAVFSRSSFTLASLFSVLEIALLSSSLSSLAASNACAFWNMGTFGYRTHLIGNKVIWRRDLVLKPS